MKKRENHQKNGGKKRNKMEQGKAGRMGEGKKGGRPDHAMQDPTTVATRTKDNLTKKLNLNTQQSDAVYQAALAQAQSFQNNKGVQGQARGEAMRASRDAFQAELKKILTPEQLTLLEQLKEDRQEKKGGRDKK